MVTASLSDGTTTFSMEVPDDGWTTSKSPTPTTGFSRKSGLVVIPVYGRTGNAGQDSGAHSAEFTLEGLGLLADMQKLDTLTAGLQVDVTTGHGRMTLISRGVTTTHLAIKSYTAIDVEGSSLLWRYSVSPDPH